MEQEIDLELATVQQAEIEEKVNFLGQIKTTSLEEH
jgi:hypothetical protein